MSVYILQLLGSMFITDYLMSELESKSRLHIPELFSSYWTFISNTQGALGAQPAPLDQ